MKKLYLIFILLLFSVIGYSYLNTEIGIYGGSDLNMKYFFSGDLSMNIYTNNSHNNFYFGLNGQAKYLGIFVDGAAGFNFGYSRTLYDTFLTNISSGFNFNYYFMNKIFNAENKISFVSKDYFSSLNFIFGYNITKNIFYGGIGYSLSFDIFKSPALKTFRMKNSKTNGNFISIDNFDIKTSFYGTEGLKFYFSDVENHIYETTIKGKNLYLSDNMTDRDLYLVSAKTRDGNDIWINSTIKTEKFNFQTPKKFDIILDKNVYYSNGKDISVNYHIRGYFDDGSYLSVYPQVFLLHNNNRLESDNKTFILKSPEPGSYKIYFKIMNVSDVFTRELYVLPDYLTDTSPEILVVSDKDVYIYLKNNDFSFKSDSFTLKNFDGREIVINKGKIFKNDFESNFYGYFSLKDVYYQNSLIYNDKILKSVKVMYIKNSENVLKTENKYIYRNSFLKPYFDFGKEKIYIASVSDVKIYMDGVFVKKSGDLININDIGFGEHKIEAVINDYTFSDVFYVIPEEISDISVTPVIDKITFSENMSIPVNISIKVSGKPVDLSSNIYLLNYFSPKITLSGNIAFVSYSPERNAESFIIPINYNGKKVTEFKVNIIK